MTDIVRRLLGRGMVAYKPLREKAAAEITDLRARLRRERREADKWHEIAVRRGEYIVQMTTETVPADSASTPPYPVCYHGYMSGCPKCAAETVPADSEEPAHE